MPAPARVTRVRRRHRPWLAAVGGHRRPQPSETIAEADLVEGLRAEIDQAQALAAELGRQLSAAITERDDAAERARELEIETWNRKADRERARSQVPFSTDLDLALERIAQLERVLSGTETWRPPADWRLTSSEVAILRVLVHRSLATSEACLAAIYRDYTRDEPDPKIIDVFVCKMRRKLRPHGIAIETVWGEGWRLDGPTRARLKARFSVGGPDTSALTARVA